MTFKKNLKKEKYNIYIYYIYARGEYNTYLHQPLQLSTSTHAHIYLHPFNYMQLKKETSRFSL